MMSQHEVPSFLEMAIPEIKESLDQKLALDKNIKTHEVIHMLTDFSLRAVCEHNTATLQRCFKAAETLYIRGDHTIKDAVAIEFIHSFPRLVKACPNNLDKVELRTIMPRYFYTILHNQLTRQH